MQLADQHAGLQGHLALKLFKRLQTELVETDGNVIVDLSFRKTDKQQRIVTGSIKTTLNLFCQRCLTPMAYDFDLKIKLALVQNEEQAKRLKGFDPLIANEETDLVELIEDELLLNLPIIPRHNTRDCPVKLIEYASQLEKPNPFADLKSKLR